MNQNGTTGKAGRRLSKRQVVEDHVVQIFLTTLRVIKVEECFLLRGHQAVVAIGLNRYLAGTPGDRNTAPTSQVVPDHLPGLFFVVAMQNGEWIATEGAIDSLSLTNNLGIHRVLPGILSHPVGHRVGAPGLINRYPERSWVGFQHRPDTIGQVVAVLIHIGCSNGEQHFVIRERIYMVLPATFITRRWLGQATIPCRNGASVITGFG